MKKLENLDLLSALNIHRERVNVHPMTSKLMLCMLTKLKFQIIFSKFKGLWSSIQENGVIRLRQFSFFLVARSGKLGHKTACPNNKAYVKKLKSWNMLMVCR